MCCNVFGDCQDLRRLTKALQHLKKYTDVLMHHDASDHPAAGPDPKVGLDLYWDSWTRDYSESPPTVINL